MLQLTRDIHCKLQRGLARNFSTALTEQINTVYEVNMNLSDNIGYRGETGDIFEHFPICTYLSLRVATALQVAVKITSFKQRVLT